MKRYCLLLLCVGAALCQIFGNEEFIPGTINLGPERHNAELYYILFKCRDQNPKAPLIWYFEGGPGQSTMHGLFYQNGPYRLKKDETITPNEYSFNNMADVLYVDQPLGTGFSNVTNTSWVPHNERAMLGDLVTFLTTFYQVHPEYVGRPLFLQSQGYGSHFALPLAHLLAQKVLSNVNYQGLALGSPWIRPELQITSLASFSKETMHCGEFKYIASMYGFIIASIFIDLDLDVAAFDLISLAEGVIIGALHHEYNRNDFRIRCTKGPCNYNFSELNTFLDEYRVRSAMHTIGRHFNYTSPEVFRWLILSNEYLSDKSDLLIFLIEHTNTPVYIFSGLYDWTINTLGMDETIASLHWTGREQLATMKWKSWYTEGRLEGRYKHHKRFYYVHALHAGHYVGMDAPAFTLDLMMRLIYGSDH